MCMYAHMYVCIAVLWFMDQRHIAHYNLSYAPPLRLLSSSFLSSSFLSSSSLFSFSLLEDIDSGKFSYGHSDKYSLSDAFWTCSNMFANRWVCTYVCDVKETNCNVVELTNLLR